MGDLVLLNYQNATVWHACPSFHVVAPWLFYRAAQLYGAPWLRSLLVLFIAIACSTVMIRIHYLADIAAGLLVGEAAFRFVLRPLEKRDAFAKIPSRVVVPVYAGLVLLAAASLFVLR